MKLSTQIPEFVKWLVFKAPKKIFVICYRLLRVTNNEFGLTLNIGLIFTPIFGDYSFMGRLIGFIFRVVQILASAVVMLALAVMTILTPLIFVLTPAILLFTYPILVIPALLAAYVYWATRHSDNAVCKIPQASVKLEDAFKPSALTFVDVAKNDFIEALNKFELQPDIIYLLKKSELTPSTLLAKLKEAPEFDKTKILETSFEIAKSQGTNYVHIEQVFVALVSLIPKSNIALSTFGSSLGSLSGAAKWIVIEREKLDRVYLWQDDYELPQIGGIGRTMTGRVTPALDRISEDFTKQATKKYNKRHVAHKAEMDKVAQILSGSKVNVLIVGEPGSGKTSIVRNLAFAIARGTKYSALKFKRIVNIETGKLIAGAKNSGDLAAKLKYALDEVEKSGDVIIFIDEIHNIVSGVSSEETETSSIFSILESYLTNNSIQFIGATSVQNYRKFIEPNGAFARIFQIVELPPSSKEETLEVIQVIAAEKEKENKVFITYPALEKIIELSNKLIQERVFPDKAIDVLIRTLTSSRTDSTINKDVVSKVISEVTKVPVENLSDEESNKLLKIEDELKSKVIGQDEAISLIAKALKRARAGMRNESKPIASFLFVGTTGVGKTETAKALARTYFGSTKQMIRLDMSEYQQVDSINKLIGSPDGTMKGTLTEAVRSTPFSLILLDEIEKAYPSVLLAFLQVLDDGRLTDTFGRTIDFTNTIIIATSNVGTKSIQDIAKSSGTFEQMSETAMTEVRNKYAPEFLNRFNGIIVYKPLNLESVRKICLLQLQRVIAIAKEKGIELNFKPELIDKLIEKGFSPEWGARPLTRVIEDSVESFIATKMISKEFKMGDEISLGLEVFQ